MYCFIQLFLYETWDNYLLSDIWPRNNLNAIYMDFQNSAKKKQIYYKISFLRYENLKRRKKFIESILFNSSFV